MSELTQKRQVRRGRIFPDLHSSPDAKAKTLSQKREFGLRCRKIFEQIRPQLMQTHYNWFIAVDAETGNYILDPNFEGLMQKIKLRYPAADGKTKLTAFRLNEQGYCGLI